MTQIYSIHMYTVLSMRHNNTITSYWPATMNLRQTHKIVLMKYEINHEHQMHTCL